VTRRWRYKRDEEGRPRRFLSHREAFLWSTRRIGFYALLLLLPLGSFSLLGLVGALGRRVVRTTDGELPGWEDVGAWMLAVSVLVLSLLSLLSLLAGAYYLYIALAGGVMSRDERQRYHEEREARGSAGRPGYGRP
jgi:hypothetical protein